MIFGIVFALLCVLMATSAVVFRAMEEYKSNGNYLDISLKWILSNFVYFIGQMLFPPIKYLVVGAVVGVVVVIFIGIGFMGGEPDGSIFPDFVSDDWVWYEEKAFWFFLLMFLSWIWEGLCFIGKALFVSPFVWIGKQLKNIKDISFFRIGERQDDNQNNKRSL